MKVQTSMGNLYPPLPTVSFCSIAINHIYKIFICEKDQIISETCKKNAKEYLKTARQKKEMRKEYSKILVNLHFTLVYFKHECCERLI